MNRKGRKCINTVLDKLEELRETLADLHEKEEQTLDNIPYNLKESILGERVADKILKLEDACNAVGEAYDVVEQVLNDDL